MSGCIVSNVGSEGKYCWDLSRTNSITSIRQADGLAYIKIWVVSPKRLVFWDGAPIPSIGMMKEMSSLHKNDT